MKMKFFTVTDHPLPPPPLPLSPACHSGRLCGACRPCQADLDEGGGLCLFVLAGELAAGGGDFSAAAFADVGVYPPCPEDVLKAEHGLTGGAFEGEFGDFVVVNEVDV